jgi:alkylation response protein AidB-like acyl-CoA dehydrogenase
MEELPWERLQIAVSAVAGAQAAIDWTMDYVKERKGVWPIRGHFPEHPFTLAELQTEVQVARVFVDKCCELICQDKLDTATASMAKYWTTDLHCKVMDECVQLFGGYGYMWEYPIARAYADARVQRIYGGTNEIMKEVITRAMGLFSLCYEIHLLLGLNSGNFASCSSSRMSRLYSLLAMSDRLRLGNLEFVPVQSRG